MKESRKKFIIEAHENACNEWKQKIEKEFPKLFKKNTLEINKWYVNDEGFLHCYKGSLSYGFNWSGVWSNKLKTCNDVLNFRPASEKEVKDALIKEAKKRGIWDCPILSVSGNTDYHGKYIEEFGNNELWSKYGLVFLDGEWATPIKETITKEEAEKLIGKKII